MDKKIEISEKISDFLILCKTCNEIVGHSNLFEKIHILGNEISIILSKPTQQLEIQNEIHLRSEKENVDYQCVYKEVSCKKCQARVGVFYISTNELLDHIKEKCIVFESSLKFYSIADNKFQIFREFCFENEIIDSNLDHLNLLKETNKNENLDNKNNDNDDTFPELTQVLTEVKNAFNAMNDGMKMFEARLSQSEQTLGILLTAIGKIKKRIDQKI